MPLNVIGTELEPCALDPVTGFPGFRSGVCRLEPFGR